MVYYLSPSWLVSANGGIMWDFIGLFIIPFPLELHSFLFQYKAIRHASLVGPFKQFLIMPKRDTETRH